MDPGGFEGMSEGYGLGSLGSGDSRVRLRDRVASERRTRGDRNGPGQGWRPVGSG